MRTENLGIVVIICACAAFFGAASALCSLVPLEKESTHTPLTPFTQAEIDSFTKEARALHDQGDYVGAIALYEQIIEHNPQHVQAYAALAHTHRYAYHYTLSEEWFKKAIALDPTDPFLYTDLGKLYRNMGRYPDAEAAFLKALSIDPFFASVYDYGLGYLYLEEDRYDEAEMMFKKALSIDETDPMTYMALGDLYRETRDYGKSEDMFKKAIQLDPRSESYYGMGILFEHQGQLAKAEEMYRSYLRIIREKGEVYNALSRVLSAQGRFDEAIQASHNAIELNPGNPLFEEVLSQAEAGAQSQ